MRVDGSLPMHIARAYGVRAAAPVAPPAAAAAATARPAGLVAGTVAVRPDFVTGDPGTAPPAATVARSAGSYAMYTRAADLVEAAVSVQVGRTIDLTA